MKRQSQTRRVVVAFFRAPSGWIAIVSVGILVVLAIVAPIVLGRDANQSNFADLSAGASSAHLLGTDQLGRDVLARMLVATRLSLELGTAAAALAFGLGVPLSLIHISDVCPRPYGSIEGKMARHPVLSKLE